MYKLYYIWPQQIFTFSDIMVEDSHDWISTMDRACRKDRTERQGGKVIQNVRL